MTPITILLGIPAYKAQNEQKGHTDIRVPAFYYHAYAIVIRDCQTHLILLMSCASAESRSANGDSRLVLEYNPNSNVSLAGMPRGPAVWVILINGFVFILDYNSFALYIYFVSHAGRVDDCIPCIFFCKLSSYSGDHRLVLVFFFF
jgi:hypothetical protein